MTRRRADARNRHENPLDRFFLLTKADALLFYVADTLKQAGLKDVERSVEAARTKLARRLEACQDAAYMQMTEARGKRPSHSRSPRPRRKPKKRSV